MSRYISKESAIAFSGTEHESHIVDDETKRAVEVETNVVIEDPTEKEKWFDRKYNSINETVISNPEPADVVESKNANPFLDDDDVTATEAPVANEAPVTPVVTVESIIEDLEEVVADTTVMSEFDVKVNVEPNELELTDAGKEALDTDVNALLEADPEGNASLESILLCNERNVGVLLDIFKNHNK